MLRISSFFEGYNEKFEQGDKEDGDRVVSVLFTLLTIQKLFKSSRASSYDTTSSK